MYIWNVNSLLKGVREVRAKVLLIKDRGDIGDNIAFQGHSLDKDISAN